MTGSIQGERFGAMILAGGLATRMGGRPKSELKLAGHTFLEIAESLLEEYSPGYVSVMNPGSIPVGRFLQVPDYLPEKGPLGGIYSVLRVSIADKLVTLPCDMPFMTKEVIDYIISEYSGEDVLTIEDSSGREFPLCGIYTTGCLGAVKKMVEEDYLKVRVLREKVHARVLRIPKRFDGSGWMHNINTPEAYEQCRERNSGKNGNHE